MAAESINPNVVLTANNSQYDQAMQSSATTTDALANSVDTLTAKITSLTKSASKFSFGIAAADVAVISAATAAWAAYENQMSRLQAQAAVVTRTQTDQTRSMQSYTRAVNDLRSAYGTSTNESAQLVENISKLTENRNVRGLSDMSKIFVEMSKATGENSSGLATSVLNLQKVMGTSINQNTTRKYADQVTYLSKQTSMSATGLADFASQIAPIGRQLNLTQTEIMGVSTAFAKSGQDGFTAANAFSKIVSDIAYATQSGSPDLAKYANLVGLTVGQFNELGGSDKILKIFDQLNTMGPRAVTELNRLGLDGMRTMRAITAMSNQSGGGLRAGIREAQEGLDSNANADGAKASMQGMVDELQKLKSEAAQVAEIFGSKFGPGLTKGLQGIEAMSSGFRKMMDGPLGDVVAAIATLAGGAALGAGSLLGMAAPLATAATGALLLRGSGAMGLREGFRGAPPVQRGVSLPNQGMTGTQIATNGSWLQRGMYNAGARVGNLAGTGASFFGGRGGDPLWQRGISGGLNASAWGIRNLAQPIYSPLTMRGFNDPTQRSRFINDGRTPFQQARDAFSQRRTGRADASNEAARARQVVPGASLFDRDARIGDDGRVTSSAATQAVRQAEVTRAATGMSAAFANVTRASGALAGSMASAATNAAWLGGKAAGKVGAYMAGNSSMVGAGALMAGSAMGIQSQALTFGATGMMFGGPMGGAIGAGLGAGLDIYQGNKGFNSSVSAYKDTLQRGSLGEQYISGQYVQDQANNMLSATGGKAGWTNGIPVVGGWMGGNSLQSMGSKARYGLEGIFTGEDPVAKRVNAAEEVERNNQTAASAWLAVSSKQGKPIDKFRFDDQGDWAKLDAVLQSVTPQMDKLGITASDVTKTWSEGTKSGDFSKWKDLLDKLANPGDYTGLTDRITGLGRAGSTFAYDYKVNQAISRPEDVNAQYQAINSVLGKLTRDGTSVAGIVKQMGDVQATVGDESDPNYQLASGISGMAQRSLAYRMPFMSRTQGFQAQANLFGAQRSIMSGDPNQQANMQTATDTFMQSANEQGGYFKSLLLQQREFQVSRERAEEQFSITQERAAQSYGLSRKRAEEDYQESRKYQEADFQLSRDRAEHDYQLTRERGRESFNRSMARGQADFNLQRKRQEQDYQHQVMLMVESSAKAMYNIYERVNVKRTDSAGFILTNAQDQLKRMEEQSANLDKLRAMGMSDDTIQQMGFTDPENAQQLARFVSEAADNPELIKQLNAAIKKRLKAARDLVTDESSADWEEFQRGYKLSQSRAQADFERSVKRARKDFRIQMGQMATDFQTQMTRQEADYETMQERQQKAFSKSMKRGAQDYGIAMSQMAADFKTSMTHAQEDIARAATEINGNLEQILTKSMNTLGGTAGKQAGVVLKALKNLDVDASTQGVQLMEHMAEVFGFKYKAPKGHGVGSGQGQSSNPHDPNSRVGMATGGVMPGYTPGVDVHHFTSPTAGKLSLSGGEAIMVPEWTQKVGGPAAVAKMNAAARYGGSGADHSNGCASCFATGGVYNPDEKVYMNGMAISRVAAAQIALAKKTFGMSIYMMQGGYGGNHIAASGSSHDYPGVGDFGVGSIPMETNLRKVGFAAWARNIPGRSSVGSGAHVHAASLIDPGNASAPQVYGSWPNHGNGLSGANNDPAPHVPWLPDLMKQLKQFSGLKNLGDLAGGGSIHAAMPKLSDMLKDRYPALEKAAAKVTMGGGLFKDGYWSDRMNTLARKAYKQNVMGEDVKKWYGEGSIFNSPATIGVGEHGSEAVIPLNSRGADFMSDVMEKSRVNMSGRRTNLTGASPVTNNIYQYRIDRSTNFTGAITVQANNPNELIQQLRNRNRTAALSQASIGGAKL